MKKLTALLLTALLTVSPLPPGIWAGENTASNSQSDVESAAETAPGVSPVNYDPIRGETPSCDGVSAYPWNNLIVYQKNGLYGGYSTTGAFTCEAKYENIVGVNGYVLAVEPNGNHTLFDNDGAVRMNADAFRKAMTGGYEVNSSSIGDNLIGLYKEDSADRYTDFNGVEYTAVTKLLAESPAGTVSSMQEGLIKISEGDRLSASDGGGTYAGLGTVYFVDSGGNEVLPREQGYAYMDFSGGLVLRVRLEPGYPQNESVTPLAFYDAEGSLVCEVPEAANGKNSYVCFVEQDLETRLQFSEAGLAAFQDKDTGLYGFFNKEGEITIPARYESCVLKFESEFGIAGVTLPGSELLTYIDKTGYELFSIPWPSPWPLNINKGLFVNNYLEELEDVQTVKVEARDMRGAQVFASDTVRLNGEVTDFAYIFGEGTPVPSERFIGMTVEPYSRTVIAQAADKTFGLYDMNGLEIIPPRYESIQPMGETGGDGWRQAGLLLYRDGAYESITFDTRYFQYGVQPDDPAYFYEMSVFQESPQTFIINGEAAELPAMLSGRNYAKLDDLCRALDIDISYDCLTLTVYTDKTKPYAGTRSLLPDSPGSLNAVAAANPYEYKMEPGDIGEFQSRVVSGQAAITGRATYSGLPVSHNNPHPRIVTAESQAPERVPYGFNFDSGFFSLIDGYYYYSVAAFARDNDIYIAYDIDRNAVILDTSKPWKGKEEYGNGWWSSLEFYYIPYVDSSGEVVSALNYYQTLNADYCDSPTVIENGFTLEAQYEEHPYANVFRITEYATSPEYPVEEVVFAGSGLQIIIPLEPGAERPPRATETVFNKDNDWTEEYLNRRGRIFCVTVNGERVEGDLEPFIDAGYQYIFPRETIPSAYYGELKTIRIEIREPSDF